MSMETVLFPILVALAVASLAWGLAQFGVELFRSDRRRIHQRLTSEFGDPLATQRRSILLQMEASGVSATLARNPLFQQVYRNLIQAFPSVTLTQFLCAAGGLGLVSFLLATVIFDSLVF